MTSAWHNSLHELDIDQFKWSLCLDDNDNGPIKKEGCGMVAIHQALLVVGGVGSLTKNPQPLAQYDDGEGLLTGLARTNEHHLHSLGTGELRSVMTCAVWVCVCLQDVCVWVVDGWRMEDDWGGSGVEGGTSACTTIVCLTLLVLCSRDESIAPVIVGLRDMFAPVIICYHHTISIYTTCILKLLQ